MTNDMEKKYFLLQHKGMVGKSTISKYLTLKALKEENTVHFIDVDNASASLTKFFKAIESRKTEHLKYASFNLLGPDRKIDRTKFDSFLRQIETLQNVVVDFGAASSEQFIYYLNEESKHGIVEALKELNIKLLIVMVGGGSIKECVDFFNQVNKIENIKQVAHIVANEYQGDVNGKTVKEYTGAQVQLTTLHEDRTSEAQKEWENLLNEGLIYSDIADLPLMRRRRIYNYLDKFFNQINEL